MTGHQIAYALYTRRCTEGTRDTVKYPVQRIKNIRKTGFTDESFILAKVWRLY